MIVPINRTNVRLVALKTGRGLRRVVGEGSPRRGKSPARGAVHGNLYEQEFSRKQRPGHRKTEFSPARGSTGRLKKGSARLSGFLSYPRLENAIQSFSSCSMSIRLFFRKTRISQFIYYQSPTKNFFKNASYHQKTGDITLK